MAHGNPLPARPGTYVLVMQLDRSLTLRVGQLGAVPFRAGFYAYAGSALGPGGIAARLGRHVRGGAVVHWHIDHLRRTARAHEAWFATGRARHEHVWARALGRMPRAATALGGFGSSDCRCVSHLVYFDVPPTLAEFRRALRANEAASATPRRVRTRHVAAMERVVFT